MRIFFLVLAMSALFGCYKAGPDEDQLITVPVTNNRTLNPVAAPTSPLPGMMR